jgi:pre-mRNA-splicing factor CWC26
MSGLADYLAKNYLTADSEKKSKKRKRKNKDAGLIIDDDDNLGWKEKADGDDEDAPMISTDPLLIYVSVEYVH